MPVEILIDENDTINAIVSVAQVSVEIVANLRRKGDSIWLNGLHLERLSGGPLHRQQMELLGIELCRYYEVENLVIQGARRTTGRAAGTTPRPIKIKVQK